MHSHNQCEGAIVNCDNSTMITKWLKELRGDNKPAAQLCEIEDFGINSFTNLVATLSMHPMENSENQDGDVRIANVLDYINIVKNLEAN